MSKFGPRYLDAYDRNQHAEDDRDIAREFVRNMVGPSTFRSVDDYLDDEAIAFARDVEKVMH